MLQRTVGRDSWYCRGQVLRRLLGRGGLENDVDFCVFRTRDGRLVERIAPGSFSCLVHSALGVVAQTEFLLDRAGMSCNAVDRWRGERTWQGAHKRRLNQSS